MIKKLLLLLTFLGFTAVPVSAQSFFAEINYQSFRPFIHFRLTLGNRPGRFSYYQSSYFKGYMDGVNSSFRNPYRFNELVREMEAYQAGYYDGLRDQHLLCDLRGYRKLPVQPFGYDDYYSPYYSVQIWLNQLSFTFLQAPERRLPHHWARHARSELRGYREQFRRHKYAGFEKQYRNHMRHLKQQAHRSRERYHSHDASPHHQTPSRERDNSFQRIRSRSTVSPSKHQSRPQHRVRSRVHKSTTHHAVQSHRAKPEHHQKVQRSRHTGSGERHVKAKRSRHSSKSKSNDKRHRDRHRSRGH